MFGSDETPAARASKAERLYIHITDIDHELWDLVELGVTFQNLNENGRLSITDRKLLFTADMKIYMNHHKVKDIVVGAIKHEDYVRIGDKSSAKSIFDSLCATYDGNEKKIIRSLPLVWRPKITVIEEAQNLKNMSLE
ncbi:aspartyl-tRNA synthetase, partial [Trifolium pratense]